MLHSINIFLHIFAGTIAIFIGLIPYATVKGSPAHRSYGRIFLWLMGIVIATAFSGALFFIDRPFLTIVTVQSFYFSFSGYRVLQTKERGFQHLDFAVMLLTIILAVSFIMRIQTANVLWNLGIVYYLLGYLFVIVGFDLLRYFLPQLIKNKRFWVYDHIYKMTGAFTALVSAGTGTILAAWEPYNQIIPASLGTIWLIFCLVYYPRQFKKQRSQMEEQQ